MYVFGWFAVGFVLASLFFGVVRQWRPRHDPTSEKAPPPGTTTATEWLRYVARSTPSGGPEAPAVQWEDAAPTGRSGAVVWRFIALVVAAALLLSFAAASDRASLSEYVLWVRSPFLGVRFQYLLWGAACGVLAQLFRTQIAAMARQSFDAAIGSGESTAWVLQGTLAILIIAAAVFLIKPDLLTYVRSFEYGGFKATFADHSTATSVADLKYKDLLWGFTLEQYSRARFNKFYVDKDSDRAYFGDLFFDSKVGDERKKITTALFNNYVEPVIESLICLEKNHPIRVAAFDQGLIKYGARWVNFLAHLKAEPSSLDFNSVQAFLEDINRFSSATTIYVKSIVPECNAHPALSDEVIQDTAKIWLYFHDGLSKLKANNKREESFQTLALIEPYLIAAAGDLIVVLNSQKEKAEFLTKMLEGFPRSDDMMTPAIVNFFYQTADAQLKSFENWPADAIVINLDYAIRCIDALIAKTSDLVVVYNDKLAKDDKPLPRSPKKFFEAVNRNLIILLAEKLALFNQRVLAGEALSQASREDWLRTYSRIVANLGARSQAPILALDNLPAVEVGKQSREMLPFMTFDPEYQVDIDISIAISSVLLGQSEGRASALSCNSSLYYLNAAATNAGAFIASEKHEAEVQLLLPRKESQSRTALTELKLNRILSTIRNWAGSACDWKQDLG
jgi:hypothetical protein